MQHATRPCTLGRQAQVRLHLKVTKQPSQGCEGCPKAKARRIGHDPDTECQVGYGPQMKCGCSDSALFLIMHSIFWVVVCIRWCLCKPGAPAAGPDSKSSGHARDQTGSTRYYAKDIFETCISQNTGRKQHKEVCWTTHGLTVEALSAYNVSLGLHRKKSKTVKQLVPI